MYYDFPESYEAYIFDHQVSERSLLNAIIVIHTQLFMSALH